MFVGLSDFPPPEVYDGDNYLRFKPEAGLFDENQIRVFIFNISKIFYILTILPSIVIFGDTPGDG